MLHNSRTGVPLIRRMLKKRPRPVRAALQEVLRLFDRGGKFVCPMQGRDIRRASCFPNVGWFLPVQWDLCTVLSE